MQLFVSVSENNDNSMADQARATKGTKLGTQADLGPSVCVLGSKGQRSRSRGRTALKSVVACDDFISKKQTLVKVFWDVC